MKNINEEIARIKSLFTEERLYGNLITEAVGGRYGWLDDLIGLIDDATPVSMLKGKKWEKFSMDIKATDGMIQAVRKNPTFDLFLKKGWVDSVSKMANDAMGGVPGSLPSKTMLSDGWWKAFKSTLKENGANLTTKFPIDGTERTLNKHLDTMWNNSATKQNLDNLQKNITERLSNKNIYKTDADIESAFSDLKTTYVDEISLFKSSEDVVDIVDDVVKRVDDIRSVKNLSFDELQLKLKNDFKIAAEEAKRVANLKKLAWNNTVIGWTNKYADAFNSAISVVSTVVPRIGKYTFTSTNKLCKALGKMKSLDNYFGSDALLKLTTTKGLMPLLNLRAIPDAMGLWMGRPLHLLAKYLGIKKLPWEESSLIYKTTIMGAGLWIKEQAGWEFINTTRYIIGKLAAGSDYLMSFWSDLQKQDRLIWRFDEMTDISECYELKYNDTITNSDQNSDAYDDGSSMFGDESDFDVVEDKKIEGKGKSEYIDWVKNQRGLDKNKPTYNDQGDELIDANGSLFNDGVLVRGWLPSNFCSYFICTDGVPLKVKCASYEAGAELVDEGSQAYTIRQMDNAIIMVQSTIPSFNTAMDSLNLNKEKFLENIKDKTKLSEEDKKDLDNMVSNLTPEELTELWEKVITPAVKEVTVDEIKSNNKVKEMFDPNAAAGQ